MRSAVVLGALGLAGCGSRHSQHCQDRMDCENGNEKDVQACEIDEDAADDIANLEGCDKQRDEYVDCRVEEARCNQNHWDAPKCEPERTRWQDCVQ